MKTSDTVILVACLIVMGFGIGFGLGGQFVTNQDRQSAIDAGVAKYISDEKTGESVFTFITNKPTK